MESLIIGRDKLKCNPKDENLNLPLTGDNDSFSKIENNLDENALNLDENSISNAVTKLNTSYLINNNMNYDSSYNTEPNNYSISCPPHNNHDMISPIYSNIININDSINIFSPQLRSSEIDDSESDKSLYYSRRFRKEN